MPQKESYEEIIRIKNLIAEIEALSLEESQEIPLATEPLPLISLLNQLKAHYESKLSKKKMTLTFEIKNNTPLPCVLGDASKIFQVFSNLLINALNYAGENTQVFITLSLKDKKWLSIDFWDTGKGIDPKDQPYIFQRFYRGDTSRTGHNGIGIGLTLAKAIVEKHGGTLHLSPDKTQKGAHFVLLLPIAMETKQGKKQGDGSSASF